MKELLISQIAPIAATAVVAILAVTIKTIGDILIEVLTKKKEEIEKNIKSLGYEEELNTAKEVWDIIEEKFRITENVAQVLGSKADEFDKLLLQKIPGLSQENIDYLRQAIAGEVNKGKSVITEDSAKQQIASLQQDKAKLQIENTNLKSKIDQINNTLNILK
ncbi:hypothetical protein CLOBY_34530 [Clostridium saccharobutylicum]|uniref:cobalt ABC transporter permease n=1 Tax=Clostridium saccharobutylicum TaxID=169679 RepID=UPI000983D0DE|nr:cobalt ABC transporter permease [Clostridium saccharobutylicum]AQS11297.1 hypothetical protein CLOBY_34530 [Clostridium saccharobutylicum]NSB88689.1 cell division protein FtsB [Clostridium saccharobutylicum]NYC30733.1 cell division protein FtsB [Clostridium saccharobutylicum]OOM15387.1 hypothetical protein CLSAB_26570 [Clostridium saccharobutylicum]